MPRVKGMKSKRPSTSPYVRGREGGRKKRADVNPERDQEQSAGPEVEEAISVINGNTPPLIGEFNTEQGNANFPSNTLSQNGVSLIYSHNLADKGNQLYNTTENWTNYQINQEPQMSQAQPFSFGQTSC